ncbi:zinc-binding alcohol dehydrogenase [Microbacterium sp. SORGH_AS_0888]|uniref:zinc-binding alcohol dehydrogenase n=1 Tax=Microbacterium sp. SORGH_AS_0888 TaxID=3041791 RepID=UPI0027D87822|nr:zinc-binding alcohol dehydrogenase [Microbacterium sp. SORGH_AS_0888]
MHSGGGPVREDASEAVLLALYLRQALGLRSPEELPSLRGVARLEPQRTDDEQALLERQWREYWAMTVEPQAHPSPVPLALVDGFDTLVALPADGARQLREAIRPLAAEAVRYAQDAHAAYLARAADAPASRSYAGAIAQHERQAGRPAHPFELTVQVLPLAQRGLWWIGSLTVAVTDGLREDVAAFDTAIRPIIAELA